MAKRVALAWSSGKDSAWSLHRLRQDPAVEPAALLTTVGAEDGAVTMHGVPRDLLRAQIEATGLPSIEVEIPWPCPNGEYESRMGRAVERLRADGIEAVAFGDLFLEDIRRYREAQMAASGVALLFPLWREDTRALAEEMIAGGLEAIVTCVDTRQLDGRFAGRPFDRAFLADLPAGVDPCGENGEFHSFVVAGPMLSGRIDAVPGPACEDGEGFARATLKPAMSTQGASATGAAGPEA